MIHEKNISVGKRTVLSGTALLVAALLSVACGEVTIDSDPLGTGAGDTAGLNDVTQDVTLKTDTIELKDTSGEPKDVATTNITCKTMTDCLVKMTGLTPCKLPKCEGGFCTEPIIQEVGKTCSAPNLAPSACQQTACDAQGECAIANLPDMTVCGTQVCGKFCEAGVCRDEKPGDYDDDNACTEDYCDQGLEIVHKPINDLGVSCDDGNACTEGDACITGSCVGQVKSCDDSIDCTHDVCVPDVGCVNTPQDSKCKSEDPCVNLACSVTDGCAPALTKPYNVGADCDDGDDCTPEDKEKCNAKGQCVSDVSTCDCASDIDCMDKDGNQIDACKPKVCDLKTKKCVQDLDNFVDCSEEAKNDSFCLKTSCDPKSGQCVQDVLNENKPCDDSSVCTSKSICTDGACVGDIDKKCDDGNPCTADVCDPTTGCKYNAAEGDCDDKNPCTQDDACKGGACKGIEMGCNDGVDCTFDACDPKTGKCVHSPKNELCKDDEPCTKDSCDALKGCKHLPDVGATCDDKDPCTTTKCGKTGKCDDITTYNKTVPGCGCQKDSECTTTNVCKVGKCVKGECTFAPIASTTKTCDTGNKCDIAGSGLCKAGSCTGGKPKDCSKSGDGKCMIGQCEASSGKCVAKALADGKSCDGDGSKCTQNDTCKAGKCLLGKKIDCSALNKGCTIGVCDKTTGKCSGKPVADKTPCDDGDFCTVLEKCTGGKCGGGSFKTCSEESDACNTGKCDTKQSKCVKIPKSSGTTCDDGKYCTVSDKCDGKGNCALTTPRVCPNDPTNKCVVGQCDESKNACVNKYSPSGTLCSDGNKCTQTDKCNTTGKCLGSNPKDCSASNTQCATGVCIPSTGLCLGKAKASGTACSDGDACTLNDKCDAKGNCVKGALKVCNDGNACTVGDKCVGGSCVSGDPKICLPQKCYTASCSSTTGACSYKPISGCGGNCTSASNCASDGNVCTTDSCLLGKCAYLPNTNTCSDGNKCTTNDKCSNGTCKAGAPVLCLIKPCHTTSCSPSTGSCVYTAMKPGSSCTDGNSCTTSDKCSLIGTCAGTPMNCDDGQVCTSDSCSKGKCIHTNNTVSCSDGNKCTLSDKCKDGKCQPGIPVVCKDDGTKCTTNKCNTLTGACYAVAAYNGYTCEQGSYSACYNKGCYCKVGYKAIGMKYTVMLHGSISDGYGGTIAVGETYGKGTDGYIVRFDRSRSTIWSHTVTGGSSTDVLKAVVRLKAGTFAGVGYHWSEKKNAYAGWLVEFSVEGKVLRTQDFSIGSKNDYLYAAVVDEWGTVWAVGKTYSIGDLSRGWILRLDPSTKIATKSISFTKSKSYAYGLEGVTYDSGYNRLTIVGFTNGGGYGGWDGLIVQYSVDSKNMNEVKWLLRGGKSSDYLHDVRLIGSYLYAVGQTYSDTAGSSDGWLLRLNRTNLSVYMDKRYGGSGSDGFWSLTNYGVNPIALGYKNNGEKYNRGWFSYINYSTGAVYKDVMSPVANSNFRAGSYVGNGIIAAVGDFYEKTIRGLLMQTTTKGLLYCLKPPPTGL